MKMRSALVVLLIMVFCFTGAPVLLAEENVYKYDSGDSIAVVLKRHEGKTVYIMLKSGAEISGKVSKLGASTVHISALTGMDYYDAVIDLSKIVGVKYRARGFKK